MPFNSLNGTRVRRMVTSSLDWQGPLFIVGMPRSGTKLIRGLLNEHPRVSISEIETEFYLYWAERWPKFGDLSRLERFESFVKQCQSLPYFRYRLKAGSAANAESWYRLCRSFTPAGVFEALIRLDTGIGDRSDLIWGDKSPSYLTHIETLREHFPNAKFLHIIRDVRDYCISMNRAWGKNVLRAAQRWNDDVSLARSMGRALPEAYLEIRYEDLLMHPAETMRKTCSFLGVDYSADLLHLSKASENIGDARGARKIVQSNIGKFEKAMSASDCSAVEAIAGKALESTGYECHYTVAPRRLSRTRMLIYQGLDGLRLVVSSFKDRGVIGALIFYLSYFRVSGNRYRRNRV